MENTLEEQQNGLKSLKSNEHSFVSNSIFVSLPGTFTTHVIIPFIFFLLFSNEIAEIPLKATLPVSISISSITVLLPLSLSRPGNPALISSNSMSMVPESCF